MPRIDLGRKAIMGVEASNSPTMTSLRLTSVAMVSGEAVCGPSERLRKN